MEKNKLKNSFTKEELDRMWDTLPYGKFHELVKARVKQHKYSVYYKVEKRTKISDGRVEVFATSDVEAKEIIKKQLHKEYGTQDMVFSFSCYKV